jgi:hypothetical protein
MIDDINTLAQLTSLDLSGNEKITDISTLTQLTSLNLFRNKEITNISTLTQLRVIVHSNSTLLTVDEIRSTHPFVKIE